MSLTNVAERLTAGERAREPRMLHVVAWYDGWGQALGLPPMQHPRRLTASEGRSWREGWAEALASDADCRAVSGPLAGETADRAYGDTPDTGEAL